MAAHRVIRRGHFPAYLSQQAGETEVERFTPVAFDDVGIGLTGGYECGLSVAGDYEVPFPFIGTIVRAEISVTGPVVHDPVAEVAVILASQ